MSEDEYAEPAFWHTLTVMIGTQEPIEAGVIPSGAVHGAVFELVDDFGGVPEGTEVVVGDASLTLQEPGGGDGPDLLVDEGDLRIDPPDVGPSGDVEQGNLPRDGADAAVAERPGRTHRTSPAATEPAPARSRRYRRARRGENRVRTWLWAYLAACMLVLVALVAYGVL
jgi:hypothetical protein